MQIRFHCQSTPRQLSLNAFSWDENELCNHFQGCGDNQGFLKVWMEYVHPFLDHNGIYTGP